MKILVIEDDPEMCDFLIQGLSRDGHTVEVAADGKAGLDAAQHHFDAIILDRMLPELDGIEVLQALRQRGQTTPVLMLSALGDVDHRVSGLQHGADDYLAKPFSFIELAARLEALHRRDAKPDSTTLQLADLELDLLSHTVRRGDQTIELWPLEFRLLEYLLRNAGRVVTRNMLLEDVWNLNFDPQTNVVEVHMSRLRGKVDKGFATRLIQTVRGSGYVLRES
ncbi:MAG TPA: response regulator transcription factor [Spongiibacteraceae bacterium]|nr:response regulator transcription factor [Spongiibacteraceae bacterium]